MRKWKPFEKVVTFLEKKAYKKKDKIDKQLYLQALREYFNDRTNDHAQLIRYAKIFHIERPVRDYMDILTS